MRELLDKLASCTVHEVPYPHIVIENALAPERCEALLKEMPSMEILTRGEPPRSNHRFSLAAWDALADTRVSPVWKDVMREGLSQEFVTAVLTKLAPHIRREHPDFETRFGPIERLQAAQRQEEDRPVTSVGMDVQIAVNTPALTAGTAVRGGHLDLPDKIFTGLLYLRHAEDESTGAELELHELLEENPVFARGYNISCSKLRTVRTVPYKNNTLVLFLNTPRSVHGVTPRSVAPLPRYHINIVAEMTQPVFQPLVDASMKDESPAPPVTASAAKHPPLVKACERLVVEPRPFPILAVENVLEASLYQELARTLPDCLRKGTVVTCFEQGQGIDRYEARECRMGDDLPDNTKVTRTGSALLADPSLPPVWRSFIEANLSQESLNGYLRIFGEHILKEYPDFEERFGALMNLRARRRGVDPVAFGDVEMDVVVGLQTPVKGGSSLQRLPHLKTNNKVIQAFLYFRPEEDKQDDGAHQFFSIEDPIPSFGAGIQIDPARVSLARSVPSRGNTVVMWLNTLRSIQQVAPRGPTPYSLPFVELLVQVPEDLFEFQRVSVQDLDPRSPGPVPSPTSKTAAAAASSTVKYQSGWHAREADAKGPFRWTGPSTDSYLQLPWAGDGDGMLRLEIRHALADSAVQTLEIRVNEEPVSLKRRPSEGGILVEAVVAREILLKGSDGKARLHLHVPELKRPSELIAGNADTRRVGLGVGEISLTPHQPTVKHPTSGNEEKKRSELTFEVPIFNVPGNASGADEGCWFRWASSNQDWWVEVRNARDGSAKLNCRMVSLSGGLSSDIKLVVNGTSVAAAVRKEGAATVLEAEVPRQVLEKRNGALQLKIRFASTARTREKSPSERPGQSFWRNLRNRFRA